MKKKESAGERRERARRARTDRRETIRWEPKKADRRAEPGHRKEDKALDCIRSVYQSPPPRRRTPLVPEVAPRRVDRRLGLRRMAGVKVLVYDGIQLTKGRLRDISVKGAFIETKTLALAKGTHVEVVLKIRRGGKPTHCRLPAKVVRAERGGAAVVFGELDEQAYNILLEIVRPFEQKPAARPKIGGCE